MIDAVVNAPYVEGAREFLEDYGSLYSFFIASATPQGDQPGDGISPEGKSDQGTVI